MDIPLDGTWSLTFGPEGHGPTHPDGLDAAAWPTIPATVPGRVEEALVAAGLEPDPAVGRRAWRFAAYEDHEWWYRRDLQVPELSPGWRRELVFEGLDCLATVWIDGIEVGRSANALIAQRFAVELAPGAHRLAVRLGSAVRAGRREDPAIGAFAQACSWEGWRLRKAAHQFGWDILPRLVSAGLWRPVRLEALAPVQVRSVHWATLAVDATARRATVAVAWTFDLPQRGWQECDWRLTLEADGRVVHQARGAVLSHHGRARLEIAGAQLWWPRGWGEPALHAATIELIDGEGRVAARRADAIGLRTVALRRSEATTAAGDGEFAFIVNGERLYVRGTNWVGLDALNRRDDRRLAESLAMLAELECNMVRCWGGAAYEDDGFYAACDRLGLLVWQDFALACTAPPQDDAFAAAMRDEALAVVRRLRNHPCLALWCGGNENDDAHLWSGLPLDPNRERISRQVLPAVVRELDPLRSYLPNSPFLSPGVMAGGARPEDHLWGPRDDFLGPFYRGNPAHFVSETGFHGCPEIASLERMAEPGATLWPIAGNPALAAQAVKPLPRHGDWDYRLPLLARQARLLTGADPADLPGFVRISQITQAEALKSLIETSRIRKGRTAGLLWWNLRDGWPLISDAVVDWYGRRKAAYGVIARSQAPVAALADEPVDGMRRIAVVNDRRVEENGVLRVEDLDGGPLLEVRLRAGIATATPAGELPDPARSSCWRLEWVPDRGAPAVNYALVGPRPHSAEDLAEWYRRLGLALPSGSGA